MFLRNVGTNLAELPTHMHTFSFPRNTVPQTSSKMNQTLPCKNIKFEVGNVIITCEVDGGFKGHCLQPRGDWMNFIQKLPEYLPWY
jgi:hypothetical protein